MNRQIAKEAISVSENLGKQLHAVAHDFGHINRVRNLVLTIAQDEGVSPRDQFLLEIAALWHDLGLEKAKDRSRHGEIASELFLREFPGQDFFTKEEKSLVCFLITFHDKARLARTSETDSRFLKMLNILTDADTLDLLGERGYERAVETTKANNWPDYHPENPKGETYEFSALEFDKRFDLKKKGLIKDAKEPTLVGQLNFQISCGDNLFTKLGKKQGLEGVNFLKAKLRDLVSGR